MYILEQGAASFGQEGPGEPGDVLEDGAAVGVATPVLRAQLIVKRLLEHDQPVAPGGRAQGPPTVTQLTTYTSYTPTELRELG